MADETAGLSFGTLFVPHLSLTPFVTTKIIFAFLHFVLDIHVLAC